MASFAVSVGYILAYPTGQLIWMTVMVAEVIFMLLGFILGQIRTLQRLSWLANLAIWLNVIVIIMTYVLSRPMVSLEYVADSILQYGCGPPIPPELCRLLNDIRHSPRSGCDDRKLASTYNTF